MENNNELTIVTCLYNLNKMDTVKRRDINDYLELGRFVCSIKLPMIIFTEKELFWNIYKLRKSYGNENKTIIIIKEYEDLDYYKYLELVKYSHLVNPIQYMNMNKDTPHYVIMSWSKFTFLSEAIENNPFNSTKFAWLDFGIAHAVDKTNYELAFNNIPDKIKLMIFVNKINTEELFTINKRILASGYFTGNIENMKLFINKFDTEVKNALFMLRSPLEESVIAKVICFNQEMFTYYFGTHVTILSNYNHIIDSVDHILNNIIRNGYNNYYSRIACDQLLWSWKNNKIILNKDQTIKFLDELKLFI